MTSRPWFLALPVLALGCLVSLPQTSFAQLRGWRGAGYGGASPTYGPEWNGYSGYGNYGYNPYGMNSYNVYTPQNQNYQGMPMVGQTYGGPINGMVNPGNMVPNGNYQAFYPSNMSALDSTRARIHVQVPADAQVLFDNAPTRQTGADRSFVTPPLEANNKYSYEVTARWLDRDGKARTEKRTVRLTPGETVNVNFMTANNAGMDNNQPRRQTDEDQPSAPERKTSPDQVR